MKQEYAPCRHRFATSNTTALRVALIATLLASLPVAASALSASDPILEQRRQQEREQAERQRLEQTPDVRLPAAEATAPAQLPIGETTCFKIEQIELRSHDLGRFAWLTEALSGADGTDSPLFARSGICLGAQGISVVLKRARDALVARGFVTSRVLARSSKSGWSTAKSSAPAAISWPVNGSRGRHRIAWQLQECAVRPVHRRSGRQA